VIGYRLYYGSESRFDFKGTLKTNFFYDYYIDFLEFKRCVADGTDIFCEDLYPDDFQCENLYGDLPQCTVNKLQGPLYFALTAYNAQAESGFTQELSLTVNPEDFEPSDIMAPFITADPIVVGISDTTVTIQWSTDEIADSLIRYGLSGGLLNLQAGNIQYVATHTLVLTNLVPNTTYDYIVDSVDPSGNGPTVSNFFSFTTLTTAEYNHHQRNISKRKTHEQKTHKQKT